MKKLIFVLISVLLLASCAQGVQNPVPSISASPDVTETPKVTQTSVTPTPTAALPSQSPSPTVSITPSLPTADTTIPEPLIQYSDDEHVSKTVTIGNINKYIKTPPKELFKTLGDDVDILGYVDDIDAYVVGCDSLGIAIHYSCDFEDKEDSYVEIPKLPVKRILIDDFKFCGLNSKSSFKYIMSILGETKVRIGNIEDCEYYYLRYKINELWFEFSSEDKAGSDGVGLEIVPAA